MYIHYEHIIGINNWNTGNMAYTIISVYYIYIYTSKCRNCNNFLSRNMSHPLISSQRMTSLNILITH